MFESLRDKLFSAQQDTHSSATPDKIGCDLNAGAALLERYQNQWMLLHNATEETAKQAEDVDRIISQLATSCDKQWQTVDNCLSQLKTLPSLLEDLRVVMKKIAVIQNEFTDLESALISLENTIEVQELQEKQLNERFKLALYKEKKLTNLETFQAETAKKHAARMVQLEIQQQSALKERQVAFGEAFEEEMQHYKKHGAIERVASIRSNEESLKLEDVELDQDAGALDAFLAVEATEEIVTSILEME